MKNEDYLIPITFDKSHILTLGRKMYKENIQLIRELVNNSYDADATRVDILLSRDKIIIKDNGTGMNFDDIKQYFKIGSQHKKEGERSKIFDRKYIGEIGIRKFSSLGATSRFAIITKKGDFKGMVVFDQKNWESNKSDWNLKCEILEVKSEEEDGTTVILYDIEQHFTPQEIADRIRLTTPVNAPNFDIYLNNRKIQPIKFTGKKYPVYIQTDYGEISGELVLSDIPLPFMDFGIICCVKNVMITRSLFGFEDYRHGVRRITGKVNADFLPFTSDRNDFLINTPQYRIFHKIMHEEVRKLIKELKIDEDEKFIAQSKKALTQATQKLKDAFKELPDLIKEIEVSVSKSHTDLSSEEVTGYSWRPKGPKLLSRTTSEHKTERGHYKIPHINPVTESKVIKNVRTDIGFNFGFVNEGEEGPASFYYGNTIYVNRQHSLYQRFSKKLDDEVNHLVRILVAEAIMLTNPSDLRQYYERQIEVLSIALIK